MKLGKNNKPSTNTKTSLPIVSQLTNGTIIVKKMNNRNRSESNVIVDVFHHETNENKDFLNLFYFSFTFAHVDSIFNFRFEWIVVCIDCYFFLLLNCLKNEAFVTHTIQPWIARKLLAE